MNHFKKFQLFACSVTALVLFNGCSEKQPTPTQEPTVETPEPAPTIAEPVVVEETVEQERPDAPPTPPPSTNELPEATGQLLFRSDFDSELEGEGAALNFHTHPSFRAEFVELGTESEPNKALIIAGSDEPKHSWRPALEFRYTPQIGGRLKLSFDVYQASYDAASLNLQIVDMRSGYKVYHSMRMTNDFIDPGPGNRNRMFKDTVTAGSDARWHRFEWVMPIPGGPDSEMAVRFDGKPHGDIRHKHSESGGLDGIRMFLHLRKNADVVYYIDNVLIENIAPSAAAKQTTNGIGGLKLLSD